VFTDRIILFEYLGAAGDLAEADTQFLGYLTLRDAVDKHLHQSPPQKQVFSLRGRQNFFEKKMHPVGILNIAEYRADVLTIKLFCALIVS